jgi:hypothetical protein
MENAHSARTAWPELPDDLHRTVADLLGGPVTSAESPAEHAHAAGLPTARGARRIGLVAGTLELNRAPA